MLISHNESSITFGASYIQYRARSDHKVRQFAYVLNSTRTRRQARQGTRTSASGSSCGNTMHLHSDEVELTMRRLVIHAARAAAHAERLQRLVAQKTL